MSLCDEEPSAQELAGTEVCPVVIFQSQFRDTTYRATV